MRYGNFREKSSRDVSVKLEPLRLVKNLVTKAATGSDLPVESSNHSSGEVSMKRVLFINWSQNALPLGFPTI